MQRRTSRAGRAGAPVPRLGGGRLGPLGPLGPLAPFAPLRSIASVAVLTAAVGASGCGWVRGDEPTLPAESLMSLSLTMDQAIVADDDRNAVVMVELAASERPVGEQQPVSLAIALDASGSMEGAKIENAREAAHALIERLAPDDELTLVSYADVATVHLRNFRMGDDRDEAHAAVDGIEVEGNTCTSCGMLEAYAVLAEADPERLRRVVVLSDGHANRGYTTAADLQGMASYANAEQSIDTSTIGLGRLHNEGNLAAIAEGGRSMYYFLHNSEYLATILDRELVDLHSTVLTELAVRLRPGDGVAFVGSPNVGLQWSGADVIVPVGQLAVGERRQFLVELSLPEGDMGRAVFAHAEFRDVAGASYELEASAQLTRSNDLAEVEGSVDSGVMAQVALLASARLVEQIVTEYEDGNWEQARDTLEAQREQLQSEAALWGSAELLQEATVLEDLGSTLDGELEVDSRNSRGNVIFQRARSNERRRGVPMPQSYHSSGMYDLHSTE
jgi:Ca-activated chloride channel family protein